MINCKTKKWTRVINDAILEFQDDKWTLTCDKCKKRVTRDSLDKIVNYEEQQKWKNINGNDYCYNCAMED